MFLYMSWRKLLTPIATELRLLISNLESHSVFELKCKLNSQPHKAPTIRVKTEKKSDSVSYNADVWEDPDEAEGIEPLNSLESSLLVEEFSSLPLEAASLPPVEVISPCPAEVAYPLPVKAASPPPVVVASLPPSERIKSCIAWGNSKGLPWDSCHTRQCKFSSGSTLPKTRLKS